MALDVDTTPTVEIPIHAPDVTDQGIIIDTYLTGTKGDTRGKVELDTVSVRSTHPTTELSKEVFVV